MKKFFIFDCETGGTIPEASLLSLSGVVTNHKLEVLDTINLKIKPNDSVYRLTANSIAINNINIVEHDKTALTEAEASNEFYNFVCKNSIGSEDSEKLIPTGHNVNFDIKFVKNHLLKPDIHEGDKWERFFTYRSMDTAAVAQFLILAGKLPDTIDGSLKSLANFFDIDYSKAHDAEIDVEITLNVLKKLIGLVGNVSIY